MTTHDTSLVPFPSVRRSSNGRLENVVKANLSRRGCHKNGFLIAESPNRLVCLFEDLLKGFDQRQLRILYLRTFRTAAGSTLQNLGNDFGVCRERVRQIEANCIEIIARRLEAPRFRPLIEASASITAAIGLAVPITMANAAGFLSCQLPVGSIETTSSESLMRAFLLWSGGSYEVRDEWMIKRPVVQCIRKTRIVTNSLLRRGPASAEQMVGKVCALGFRRDVTPQWVSAFGQARILGSVAIRWQGTIADKAVALLEYQGKPMSRLGISELLGSAHSIKALSNCLSMDERVERLKRDLYGLRNWHGNRL